MKLRTTILGRAQQVLRTALDNANLPAVDVYPLAAPEDVWAIPGRPAVGVSVTTRRAAGTIPLGGGNSGQSIIARVGIAVVMDDPEGPTTAITDATYGVEEIAEAIELTLRSADLADGADLQGPIRLIFVEDEISRNPYGQDQRGGGLIALLQTFDTTEFYE
jgi:hypothetical protein